MIKFLDLANINNRFRDEINRKIKDILDSGWYLLGNQDKEFEKKIKKLVGKKVGKIHKLTLYKDKNGYVKEVEINEEKIKGEIFRQFFGLASSCFSLQKIDSVIEIQTKGIGHGFGFSQWEANCLAREGKTYEDLLGHFYKNISIEKI